MNPGLRTSSVALILGVFMLLGIWPAEATGQERDVPIRIMNEKRSTQVQLGSEQVRNIVTEELQLELDTQNYLEVDVSVIPDVDGQEIFLLAYLKLRDSYGLRIVRITLDQDRRVRFTDWDVTPEPYELDAADSQSAPDQRGTCPDESVAIVFGTETTEFPTAVDGVEKAGESATQAGFKTKVLIGSQATVSAYKNWLACKNLIIFGNIGHGGPSAIMLHDGALSSAYFAKTDLRNKILYFNSCQVHNAPLEPAIIGSGAIRFIGGDIDLRVGPSEKVFKAFWASVLTNKPDVLEPTLRDLENRLYPDKNAHGISGQGDMPWDILGPNITLKSASLSGRLNDKDESVTLLVNGKTTNVAADGSWQTELVLTPGENIVTLETFDPSGNHNTSSLKVLFEPSP